jgi:hypothetical protein
MKREGEMHRALITVLAGAVLSGCGVFGPDDDGERTYPQALDLPLANVQDVLDGTQTPGRFNLQAFVVGISECPANAACLVADHIRVSDNPHTDGPSLMIAAFKPSQFDLDERYLLSIEVFNDAFPETNQALFVQLLGYTED